MRKNEPDAKLRVAGPISFYDTNGALKKNLTFAHGSSEVFYLRGSDNTWQAAANDATEYGGANTTGIYFVQMAQAETNYDTIVGIKLVKASYDDQFWFAPIDNVSGQIYFGLAQSGGANYITLDSGASASDDFYKRGLVVIASGLGAGQAALILSYNGTTKRAYVDRNWVTQPDSTSIFHIYASTINYASSGLAQAGAAGSVTLSSSEPATDDYYKGAWITIASGTGKGQTHYCTGYTGSSKVAAVSPNWVTTPDNTSTYLVDRSDQQLVRSDIASVQTDTTNIKTRLPTALVSGRMDSSVGAVAANAITSSGLDATAVTAIQSGLGTSANQATILSNQASQATLANQTTILANQATIISGEATIIAALSSISDAVTALRGLFHENCVLNFTYTGAFMDGCRIRQFANSTAAAAANPTHADNADGEIHRWRITAVNSGNGTPSSYMLVQEL